MATRILRSPGDGTTAVLSDVPGGEIDQGWVWIDISVDSGDAEELEEIATGLQLDALAVRDAVTDVDLAKVDDFGHHLLVVLHGLRDDRVETYELDCFLTETYLVTVHTERSPAVDAFWEQVQTNEHLAASSVDELVGCLADVLTRRLMTVVEAFDRRIDELTGAALEADPDFLIEMTAVRVDLAEVRQVIQPQREALDVLRRSSSPLLSEAGRRRFSDVFDVAMRTAHELDAARSALAETLDAYRGAEAKEATNVTKVLTVYAAIMFPLTLLVGFFGMNFGNLPGLQTEWGWVVVTAAMLVIALISVGVFVALGWIRRPSGRKAGATLGRGLVEAAKAPAHVGGAIYEVSTMPLRGIVGRRPTPGSGETDERGETGRA
jgi:magnesium transporter